MAEFCAGISPFVHLIVLLWLRETVYTRRYPALLFYLWLEIGVGVLGWFGFPVMLFRPARMLSLVAVCSEVLGISWLDLNRNERLHLIVWVGCFATILCGVAMDDRQMSLLHGWNLFCQYIYLALSAVLVLTCWWFRRNPQEENVEYRAYRIVAAAMMARIFVSASFVRGGLGFALFPYTMRTWRIVGNASWVASLLIVIGYGVFMSRSEYRRGFFLTLR